MSVVQASRNGPRVTHLFFADDSILFAKANVPEAQRLQHILNLYEENSGQKINLAKSALLFSTNTKQEIRRQIKASFGVQCTNNMGKYLGIPSMIVKDRRRAFRELKEKMSAKVKTWCNRTLSQGGKQVFIKSIFQAMPTYLMSCFLLPRSLCQELDSIIKNYWWKHT